MSFLEILNPTAIEKVSFMAALIIAVVWLWWEIKALNKKRDADALQRENDTKDWKDMYQRMMNRLIDLEKQNARVIEKNTAAFNRFTGAVDELKEEIHKKNV